MSTQNSGNKRVLWNFNRIIGTEEEGYMEKLSFNDDAVIFTGAVLEYIIRDVVDLSLRASENNKKITPRSLQLAIRRDFELDKLLKDLLEGYPLPFIDGTLQPS